MQNEEKGNLKRTWMYQHISNRYSNAHKKKKKLLPRSTKAINVIMIIMIVISCFRYKLQTGHNTWSILSHWLSFLPTLLTLLSSSIFVHKLAELVFLVASSFSHHFISDENSSSDFRGILRKLHSRISVENVNYAFIYVHMYGNVVT